MPSLWLACSSSAPRLRKPTFDDYMRDVRLDLQAERYEQASQTLTTLLNRTDKNLADPQRAVAHHMLAETIYQAESSKVDHNPENARRILSNFLVARRLGKDVAPGDYRKIAEAADWMGDYAQALEAYDKALATAGPARVAILQRVIEILLAQGKRDWQQIDRYVDRLLADAADQPNALLRAVQWKMQRILSRDDIAAASRLISRVEPKLDVPPWSYHLEYFKALSLYRQQQYEAAEGRLRVLQIHLRRSSQLVCSGGLAARSNQLHW